jgi:prepilin-type N-terminal cleavage/methylation domain-containing protein
MFSTSHHSPRGFTIIELLCVVAIIGVLATVVIAALGNARSKGIDVSIKQSLTGARSQAEIFYAANGGNFYSGVCGTASIGSAKSINDIVSAAARAYGLLSVNTAIGVTGGPGIATCHDTLAGWAAEVPMKVSGQGFFCVDSTLFGATTSVSTLGANDITCGP